LTLAGSNGDDNTLASVISDSAAGGVVSVDKVGTGKWVLSGTNTYTGDTTVEDGVLSITSGFLEDTADVYLTATGVLDLDFTGTDDIDALFFDDVAQSVGLWGAVGNGAATFTSSFLTGTGLLNVGGTTLQALAAVPEPSSLLLSIFAAFCVASRRSKNR
jgi:fibronectin-binding autotransporter adhesin